MNTFRRTAAALGVSALALLSFPQAALADDTTSDGGADVVELDLYKLTDVHGHIDQVKKDGKVTEAGIASMGCYLDAAMADNENSSFTLLGDNIGASPYLSAALKDNPTIEALNELHPEASTIGNHELDMGQDVFKARVDGSDPEFVQLQFPYLGANVEGLGEYKAADGTMKPYLGDYVIKEMPAGAKVAFIGAIAQDVPYKLSPKTTEGMEFNDPIERINTLAKDLKESGKANVVVAMLDDDVKNNYPKMGKYVDALMGGDTHVPYDFDMVSGSEGNKLSAVASGSYTDNLGLIEIKYNTKTNKVVESNADLIPAEKVAECGQKTQIQEKIDKAKEASEAKGNEIISSNVNGPFKRGVFTEAGGRTSPGSNRGIESSLGDLVADSFKERVKTKEGKGVDIGIINAGGLREDLIPNEKGEVTYQQTFAVQPFSNYVGYTSITGADFKELLEQQWKTNLSSQNSRPMLKLGLSSNVSYTYDPAAEFGKRITSVLIDGKPVQADKKYTIGSSVFILEGGDSFPAITKQGDPIVSDGVDRDLFNDYLKSKDTIKPREIKGSVGVTLPKDPVENGKEISIALRGLSFSEGPSITKQVSVKVGDTEAKANVNNDLTDANAENEKAIITTDGAGQASVKVKAQADCDANAGKNVALPVRVSTDFGEVVKADNGLAVTVNCPKKATTPGTNPSEGGNQQGGNQGNQTTPPANNNAGTKPGHVANGKHNVSGKLVRTGAQVTGVVIGAAALLVLGAGLVYAMRRR
ncbi:bifunctional metallophosphatase/5'-nucleotidase [Gleimia hominis]|uniref:bifunctional metallophosphatase/5'-nucleotidase n=1 Tax=Gleimia hominis TaxID=595468 RepID=UPI000C80A725|nr:bifunctional UDP-sugar hydrolase/5'-nucleotidase [Gleimia hominis]WIK65274.1 bifunctional UDP-sugar hydrolase/5'-nucleotidase [Gleimia hominis]